MLRYETRTLAVVLFLVGYIEIARSGDPRVGVGNCDMDGVQNAKESSVLDTALVLGEGARRLSPAFNLSSEKRKG